MAAYRIGRGLAGVSRRAAFGVVAATYLAAGVVAAVVAVLLRAHHPLTVTFAADLAATGAVFLASMAAGNSSLYDPYRLTRPSPTWSR